MPVCYVGDVADVKGCLDSRAGRQPALVSRHPSAHRNLNKLYAYAQTNEFAWRSPDNRNFIKQGAVQDQFWAITAVVDSTRLYVISPKSSEESWGLIHQAARHLAIWISVD